jgi:glycosyltransferase involved in cell wall biosynthesis
VSPLRVVHVSWGFSPWLGGGLVAYVEGLMEAQAARGHEVAFFGAARHHPLRRRPAVHRWRRRGVTMYELLNSPLPQHWAAGTLRPEADLSEPWTEQAFERVLEERRPDIVHFQHVAGVPSSLLGIARAAGARVVVTLEDYVLLCPTLKLLDIDGRICLRDDVGEQCARCCSYAPAGAEHLVGATVRYELMRLKRAVPGVRRMTFATAGPLLAAAAGRVVGLQGGPPAEPAPAPRVQAPPSAYQRRREVNVARLDEADLLIAQSPRLAEIHRELGVTADLRALRHTLPHIERLRPRQLDAPPRPVTFATLNGCQSPAKGAHVVVDAVRRLLDAGYGGRFRLLVLGQVERALEGTLERLEGVEQRGVYESADLDALLEPVDVGLVPSIWEEAYGYVGLEFLAKGIPVIGSALGGIVEYVQDGSTGWLNRSAGPAELAQLMATAIDEPGEVVRLHRAIVERRDELILPMARHVDDVERAYDEVLTPPARVAPAAR